MQFIKNFFKDDTVIGLSALRKKGSFIRVSIPEAYKKTYIPNVPKNYLFV